MRKLEEQKELQKLYRLGFGVDYENKIIKLNEIPTGNKICGTLSFLTKKGWDVYGGEQKMKNLIYKTPIYKN